MPARIAAPPSPGAPPALRRERCPDRAHQPGLAVRYRLDVGRPRLPDCTAWSSPTRRLSLRVPAAAPRSPARSATGYTPSTPSASISVLRSCPAPTGSDATRRPDVSARRDLIDIDGFAQATAYDRLWGALRSARTSTAQLLAGQTPTRLGDRLGVGLEGRTRPDEDRHATGWASFIQVDGTLPSASGYGAITGDVGAAYRR